MRAQNYRPKVHPGTLAKRRTVSSASNATALSRNSRRRPEGRGQGARVLWVLMVLGGLIGSGFVMAQQSQINVYHLKRAEEQVKTQLDELTNQQRYLALEKERAINTQESERIAKQSGLVQPKLERAVIQHLQTERPEKPAAAKPVTKPAAKTVAKPVIKPPAQSKQIAKQPQVKSMVKAGRIAQPSKGKDGKNQHQLAQKQDAKKENRR